MATYKVKNLSKNSPTEIRIFSANDLNVVGSNTDFTNLDISEKNIGVILKPDYSINCNGAINYAGILDSNITSGTVIANIDGVKTLVSTDAELINILNTNFGLDAHIFEDYVPPAPKTDNEMYFTTIAGSVDYVGNQGDQIILSDGTVIDQTASETVTFTAPAGTHKVTLVDLPDRNNFVSVGGEALVELVNFPTLSTITKFNFSTTNYNDTPNLIKVPEFFPSNITDIGDLFNTSINFNQDISMWDVSNVTNFSYAFSYPDIIFNQDISGWNTSAAINMSSMFAGASSFNQDISAWNTSNVTDMKQMFQKASVFDQPIGSWNVSNVTDMFRMFSNAVAFNQSLNNWNTAKVTNMNYMFRGATAFNSPLDSWNVSKVTSMSYMFKGATSFNQDISTWDVSNVTDMSYMFYEAWAFNSPLDTWNTSNVTDMNNMFYETTSFNQSIGSWDVSKVTGMIAMFNNAYIFNQDISSWDTSKVTDMSNMFASASEFNQDLSQWCVPLITEQPTNFNFGSSLVSEYLPVWGTCPRGENQNQPQ